MTSFYIIGSIRAWLECSNDVWDGLSNINNGISSILPLLILLITICILYLSSNKKIRWRQKHNIETGKKVLARIHDLSAPAALTYLRKIDPFVFEELILTAFERKGNRIIRNQRYTGDGGIDGRIIEDGKLVLIQAKRYKAYISKQHLKDFITLVEKSNASKGYFIHTGRTGNSIIEELTSKKLKIISGQKLLDLLSPKTPKQ